MAKKQKEGIEQKANLYLLAIVAIVGIVGIVIMILNSGTASISLSESDLGGQAISPLGLCPKANTQGCSGTWTYVASQNLCTCITATQVAKGTGSASIQSEEGEKTCCVYDLSTNKCIGWC